MLPLKSALASKFKRILLIGDSGTGKTSTSATAPGSVYYADFDGGLGSLNPNQENIFFDAFTDPFDAKSVVDMAWHKFLQEIKEWRAKPKCDWFTWDSLTTGADAAMSYTLVKEGKAHSQPSLPEWGKAISEVKKVLGYLTTLPCHVIVTAHFQYVRDDTLGGVQWLPLVYGEKLPGHIPIYFRDVWRTFVEQGSQGQPSKYMLQVRPTDGRYQSIKNTLSLPAEVTNVEPNLRKLIGEQANVQP